MHDRNVSLGKVVAGALWGVVIAALIAAGATESIFLANVACALSAAAATATIRGYFCNQNRLVRAAYDIGRGEQIRRVR